MNKYQNLLNGPIDEIDAAVFLGDTFHNQKNINDFREKMKRWEKELKEIEGSFEEIDDIYKNHDGYGH